MGVALQWSMPELRHHQQRFVLAAAVYINCSAFGALWMLISFACRTEPRVAAAHAGPISQADKPFLAEFVLIAIALFIVIGLFLRWAVRAKQLAGPLLAERCPILLSLFACFAWWITTVVLKASEVVAYARTANSSVAESGAWSLHLFTMIEAFALLNIALLVRAISRELRTREPSALAMARMLKTGGCAHPAETSRTKRAVKRTARLH